MNWTEWIGRLLGYDRVTSVDAVRFSFGAPWAESGRAWVFFGCLGLCALSVTFYLKYQERGRKRLRIALAAVRAIVLCLLFVTLADPILELVFTSHPRPLFFVLVDGTDSMAIADELPSEQRARLDAAVDLSGYFASRVAKPTDDDAATQDDDPKKTPDPPVKAVDPDQPAESALPSRADYVRALLTKKDGGLLPALAAKYRVQAFRFDRPDGVVGLKLADEETATELDLPRLARGLTTDGQVTALGNALDDLALRHASSTLAGVLVVSDYDVNAGRSPLSAAKKLGVPVYALGVGPTSALDLAVEVHAPLKMKKAEQTNVEVVLTQQDLDDKSVRVRVTARRAAAEPGLEDFVVVGERDVKLESRSVTADFPFTPKETGRWIFAAEVDPVEGETIDQNNRAEREATIIDDFLRLLFVEYEPTYEWRFVKEVFHRDKLVGMRGFRTFLRSSDPTVRETNELFLPSLTLPRSEFFKYDVIFLSDVQAANLTTTFAKMTQEFVGQFGGGLVVIAGPRFGPGELAETPLADMLPVVVDPNGRVRDQRPFPLQLTPLSEQFDFMQLGANQEENQVAWRNLGEVPWYQPVLRVDPTSTTVLAQHPTDTCVDGKTPQPLIAIRRYGRGEVVYVGFNEMWRLRRKYGEKYYRQFWGQMIHRLGLSHALGSHKRFVLRTDRQQYQADDKVLLTVEAYDENFEPLTENDLEGKTLEAEVLRPARSDDGPATSERMRISQLRPGIFEVRIPVFEAGEYRVRVKDPLGKEESETNFRVARLSAERRSAVRNVHVQQAVAAETDGRAYELDTVKSLLDDFRPPQPSETKIEIFQLWSTPLMFALVVLLLLGELFVRKMVNLA